MIDTYNRLAFQLGMTPKEVENIYKAYWKCIKHHIEALPLKTDMTEEEFNKLTTSFTMKNLGKLACTYDKFQRVKRRLKKIQEIKERKRNESTSENQTNG